MGRRRRGKGKAKPVAVEPAAPAAGEITVALEPARGTGNALQTIRTRSIGKYNPPPSAPWNFWQYGNTSGHNQHEARRFGPVQTCINIISQDLSRLPIRHLRVKPDGARELVLNKAPARVFRRPNSYQTKSDLLLFLAATLLSDGNAYAWAKRNERNEVESLWPFNPWSVYPYIVNQGEAAGDILYQISSSDALSLAQPDPDEGFWVPARDMLHIRLQTPRNPLLGESPLLAAYYPAITGMQVNEQSAKFFTNMSRPGGILRHPGELQEEALKRIKERWTEVTSGGNTGDTAVLSEGMEWQQLQMTAVDAEVAAIYALSERQIFQVFRVPPFLGGDLEKATFSNVESLTRFYLQSCLGFYVDHVEDSLTRFFNLPPDEHISFDLDQALLAGDFKERMDALGRGVQNGIFAPNEARARESLPPVEFGDEPRVQQQLVPLEFGYAQLAESAQGVAPAPAEPEPAPEPEPAAPDQDTTRGLRLVYGEKLRKSAFR